MSQIFDIIKADKAAEFSEIVAAKRSTLALCFGRFPVLTLCYLYGSNKIIRQFKAQLLAVKAYKTEDEPAEAYTLFSQKAKKSLRLFIGDTVISPLEMQAILGDHSIKDSYPLAAINTEKIRQNIVKIYSINHSITATVTTEKITVGRVGMPSSLGLITKVGCLFFAFVIVVSAVALGLGNAFIGRGVQGDEGKVYSDRMLMGAIKNQSQSIVIMNDITLTTDTPLDFSGSIDGGGNTLHLKESAALFDKFSGSIKNLTIEISVSNQKQITQSTAFFALSNSGTIEDITLKIDGEAVFNPAEGIAEVMFSPFVQVNLGAIKNVTAEVDLSATNQGVDTYLGIFAASNNSEIADCRLTGAGITTDGVDTGGFAAVNQVGASITNCTNDLAIAQHTSRQEWTPNTGGIVMINRGSITGAINNGAISASTTAQTANGGALAGGIAAINHGIITAINNGAITASVHGSSSSGAFSAGIAASNQGTVQSSKNNGAVVGFAASSIVYAGGIAAYSNYIISQSIGLGSVAANSGSDTTVLFGGGVAGCIAYRVINNQVFNGRVINSLSAALVSSSSSGEMVFLGCNLGGAYANSDYIDCYYFGMEYGVSGILVDTMLGTSVSIYNDTTNKLSSMSELTTLTIWW